jgi:hypothetical protein
MTRGKSSSRTARIDLMRSREANARHKAKQQWKSYDQKRYDKPISVES